MADVVSRDVRSRMMSGIRGKNTRPEMLVRRGLHAMGFRYLLHDRRLPGKPDLVFPKHRAVIFVHGCFWHRHDCHLFKWPKTRKAFWRTKIERNKWLDEQAVIELRKSGWRVGIVWECTVKGRTRLQDERAIALCASWLRSRRRTLVLLGTAEPAREL